MSLTQEDLDKIQGIISHELNGKLDARFNAFESKFDAKLDAKFAKFKEEIDKDFVKIHDRLDGIENRLGANERVMTELSAALGH